MIQNYEKLVERIAKSSGLDIAEINRRVEAKRSRLSGLISKEGAAQVVAAELGISFDNEKLKLEEIVPGMKKVNTLGKVIQIFPVREFNKNGKQGKVANFIIADETSNLKVVLWDTNHISLIEENKIESGTVVEIMNASARESEIHLGSFSELKISKEVLSDVKQDRMVKEKGISEFGLSDSIKTRAFILQVFDPRFYEVCPNCGKKVTKTETSVSCAEHGEVTPQKKAILNIVIDDGTDSIRTVLFDKAVSSLGVNFEEDFNVQKSNLLGKELWFSGNVRKNNFFNTNELIIDSIEEVDLDKLISVLEKN